MAKAAAARAEPGGPDAEGFEPYDAGTYGAVSYNRATDEIRKRVYLYSAADGRKPCTEARAIAESHVEYSTVCELATYAAAGAAGVPGVPALLRTRFDWDALTAELYFPHAGESLCRWMRARAPEQRRAAAARLMCGLARVALRLSELGVQNTDIKPANVLVRAVGDEYAVSLIDYNLVSCYVGQPRGDADRPSQWSASFGTWCYSSPEVLYRGTPHERSPVWSIGLLLCTLTHAYPYEGYRALRSAQLNSQSFWRKAFSRLQKESPDHLPLPKGAREHFTDALHDLYCRCTAWDAEARPTLAALAAELAALAAPDAPAPSLAAPVADARWTPMVPRRLRQRLIRTIWANYETHLQDAFKENVAIAAMLYVDRAATRLAAADAAAGDAADPSRPARLARLLGGAALHLAVMFYEQYIYDAPGLGVSHALFADKVALWELGRALRWELLVPRAIMQAASAFPEVFRDALLRRARPYSDDDLLRDIKAAKEKFVAKVLKERADAEARRDADAD